MTNGASSAKPSKQQTLQQERAASAWENVQDIAGRPFKKDYGSLVRGFAAMIQGNGLGPALAFLKAKGKGQDDKAHTRLFNHISGWTLPRLGDGNNGRDLLEALLSCNSTEYRIATAEALAYVNWLKRFAEAQGLTDEASS